MVDGLNNNLLGLQAIQALNLAVRLDETTPEETPLSSAYIHQRFKQLFHGLGNLGEEYQIHLKPGATPFALFTPRRVPLPLMDKVAAELQRMGVISQVDVPTPWCAGMVVAPKKSRRKYEIAVCIAAHTAILEGDGLCSLQILKSSLHHVFGVPLKHLEHCWDLDQPSLTMYEHTRMCLQRLHIALPLRSKL